MSVAIRNPELGNTWRLTTNTVVHRTMGGNLLATQLGRPMWEGFSFQFKALSLTNLTMLKTFLIQNAGQVVNITDFEGRVWTGVVTSDKIVITKGRTVVNQHGVVLGCNYQVAFDFEGSVATPP